MDGDDVGHAQVLRPAYCLGWVVHGGVYLLSKDRPQSGKTYLGNHSSISAAMYSLSTPVDVILSTVFLVH